MSIGIVGGTGLNALDGAKLVWQQFPETPYGKPSAPIDCLELNGQSIFFLARHGRPHQIAPHKINYRANIYALNELGVKSIVGVNMVGAINRSLRTPQLVVPHQIIDLTYGREQTFFDGEIEPLHHIDFTFPFDEALRGRLIHAAKQQDLLMCDTAVYVCTQGPRLETAAEIDYLETLGADIVGMTAMPEAALAREQSMAYANLCLVVNPAAGRTEKVISLDEIERAHLIGMQDVYATLNALIQTPKSRR